MSKHALDLPEISHMLDVLTGSQSALSELLKTAQKEKDPSIIRLCVSEAETISKTAVRLAQSLTSWEAQNPGEANRNLPPPAKDPELQALAARFLDALAPLAEHVRETTITRHIEALASGEWREADYQRSRDHVRTPLGDTISVTDWFAILAAIRNLTEAEKADLKNITKEN